MEEPKARNCENMCGGRFTLTTLFQVIIPCNQRDSNLFWSLFYIATVIEDYKSGKITYAEAEFNARNRIYQSANTSFNPDVEYMKNPLSRDVPPVDNSLFILARKLILE